MSDVILLLFGGFIGFLSALGANLIQESRRKRRLEKAQEMANKSIMEALGPKFIPLRMKLYNELDGRTDFSEIPTQDLVALYLETYSITDTVTTSAKSWYAELG
jgi:hypothetical protein